jgi:hypothetical protein
MGFMEFDREGLQQFAIGRMAFGVAGFAAPRTFGRMWVGRDAGSPRVAMITRAFAIRDFALGLGVYLAAQRRAPVRGWIEAGLLCDTGDVLGTMLGPVPAARKVALVGAAAMGVVGGVLALQHVEELTPST